MKGFFSNSWNHIFYDDIYALYRKWSRQPRDEYEMEIYEDDMEMVKYLHEFEDFVENTVKEFNEILDIWNEYDERYFEMYTKS